MKMRHHRRKQSRRWDSVHSSWDAVLEHEYMWVSRKTRPCSEYTAWCSSCNLALFPKVYGRFPRNVGEFYDFEEAQQLKETPL
jgi:hypothetical protein